MLVENSKMLGRDFSLGKSSNPLDTQSLSLNTVQTQTILEKQKLLNQLLNIEELNKKILDCGNMAQCFYKAKNQLMAHMNNDLWSPYKMLKAQCRRMIQLINFNISAHIFELKQEQDEIANGTSLLAQIYKPQNNMVTDMLLRDALKYREQVTNCMIQDGWETQAINLLEQNREFQKKLHLEQDKPIQFFKYEMQILNYSKNLTKQERCRRFRELLDMDFNSQGDHAVNGQLIGAGLIWARASFDVKRGKSVQINTYVNLKVELFTRVKDGFDIETTTVKFNEQNFNFETKNLKLNRDKPLLIEKDIYLDETHFMMEGDVLMLNHITIKLKGKPIFLSFVPYLTAKDLIKGKMDQKGAGLKKPVIINIDEMPQKLDIKLEAEPHGLQGNRQRLDIFIDKAENINLSELKIKIADVYDNFNNASKSQP